MKVGEHTISYGTPASDYDRRSIGPFVTVTEECPRRQFSMNKAETAY